MAALRWWLLLAAEDSAGGMNFMNVAAGGSFGAPEVRSGCRRFVPGAGGSFGAPEVCSGRRRFVRGAGGSFRAPEVRSGCRRFVRGAGGSFGAPEIVKNPSSRLPWSSSGSRSWPCSVVGLVGFILAMSVAGFGGRVDDGRARGYHDHLRDRGRGQARWPGSVARLGGRVGDGQPLRCFPEVVKGRLVRPCTFSASLKSSRDGLVLRRTCDQIQENQNETVRPLSGSSELIRCRESRSLGSLWWSRCVSGHSRDAGRVWRHPGIWNGVKISVQITFKLEGTDLFSTASP